MPGSDDQYDQVHTYSQDHAGKSKTTKPAVREIGRDGAAVELFVGSEIDETTIRTPPSGVRFLFFNTSGTLKQKNPNGSLTDIGKSTEAVQDDVGAMVGNALTYDDAAPSLDVDETAISHDNLADVSPADHRTDENIQDTVGNILNEPLDYDDATPAVDVSTNTNRLAVSGGDLDVVDEGIQDIVGGMTGANLTYDDANNVIDASGGQNVPDWTEDGNSPQTQTNQSSHTYTLASSYDIVKVFLQTEDRSSSANAIDLQINGDTGNNYNWDDNSGTSTSGASSIAEVMFLNAGGADVRTMLLDGRWAAEFRIGFDLHGQDSKSAVAADNSNVSSPLSQFTLTGSGNFDATIEVYGRDIGTGGLP